MDTTTKSEIVRRTIIIILSLKRLLRRKVNYTLEQFCSAELNFCKCVLFFGLDTAGKPVLFI